MQFLPIFYLFLKISLLLTIFVVKFIQKIKKKEKMTYGQRT